MRPSPTHEPHPPLHFFRPRKDADLARKCYLCVKVRRDKDNTILYNIKINRYNSYPKNTYTYHQTTHHCDRISYQCD